jgi:hypothetical protein
MRILVRRLGATVDAQAGRQTSDLKAILDRHRHTMQSTQRFTRGPPLIGSVGFFTCSREPLAGQDAAAIMKRLQPFDEMLHDFSRAVLTVRDTTGKLNRGEGRKFAHG